MLTELERGLIDTGKEEEMRDRITKAVLFSLAARVATHEGCEGLEVYFNNSVVELKEEGSCLFVGTKREVYCFLLGAYWGSYGR